VKGLMVYSPAGFPGFWLPCIFKSEGRW
jgi:hypothetical protein